MATWTWKGGGTTSNPASGIWSLKSNWSTSSTASVPGAADTVMIAGSGIYTVSFDVASASITALTLSNSSATLALSGGSLTASRSGSAAISNAGTLTLAAGSLKASGSGGISNSGIITSTGASKITGGSGGINNSGTLTVSADTLTVSGRLTDASDGLITIASGSTLATSGVVTVDGHLDVSGELHETASVVIFNNGSITLAGGTVSAPTGAVLNAGTLTGYGKLALDVTDNGGLIEASGGTLEITGALTAEVSLQFVAGGVLKISGTGLNSAMAFTLDQGTIEVASSLTISNEQSVTGGTIRLDPGSVLTNSSGFAISSGMIIGAGKLDGSVSATGGQITATGGTLEITGAVSDPDNTLALAVLAEGDRLLLDSSAAAQALTFQTTGALLELGAAASLVLSAELVTGANMIKLDGSSSSLVDAAGLTLTAGTISGSGSISTGSSSTEGGTVIVTGGKLEFLGKTDQSLTSTFHIANASGNVLKFDDSVGTSDVNPTIIFDAAAGAAQGEVLDLSSISAGAGSLTANFHGIIAGFTANAGNVDLDQGILVSGATNVSLGGANHNILTVFSGSENLGSIAFATDMSGYDFKIINGNEIVTCFMAGTLIATPSGACAIESLKRGAPVFTADGSIVPVRWIGRQTISTRFSNPMRVLPIRIQADALADNVPSRDLLISPDHALLVDDVLVQAGALVNGNSIVRERKVPERFTYYHVELDAHALILAENTAAETFVDNVDRSNFDNWDEYEALCRDARVVVEMPYPRAKSHRQVPQRIRLRLAARGAEMYGSEAKLAAG